MSTFVSHLHQDLSSRIVLPSTVASPGTPGSSSQSRQALRACFLDLHPPTSLTASTQSLKRVQKLKRDEAFVESSDSEEEALWTAIAAKLTVGIYTQLLEVYLNEASEAEAELEWWSDIQRSRWRTSYFLLQTFPVRVANLTRTILQTLRSQNIPLHLSVFTPSSLRQLFPSKNILRPNLLTVALFPHLRHEEYSASAVALHPPNVLFASESLAKVDSAIAQTLRLPSRLWNHIVGVVDLPIRLARHECSYKRKELVKIRDERAAVLGSLIALRDHLMDALRAKTASELRGRLTDFCTSCYTAIGNNAENMELLTCLKQLTETSLPAHISSHEIRIQEYGLRRPSSLVLAWPKLVFLPPLGLYAAKLAYHSRESLSQIAQDAVDTLKSFWNDWLLGPLKDVVKTVRAGSDDGVIVTKESVQADLDSLERMALSLAKDKLNYTPAQMTALSQQIRTGDLTSVMQIYEDDIRSPLRSALGGTLLRTLLVQVQKAKVDIDQALSGIDKLLKSQELTFAFVGVAPAIAIVYGFGEYLRTLWTGSRGNGRHGGRKRRASTRIERLLIVSSTARTGDGLIDIDPRTSGLLLLSTTHLRKYAETYLPRRSRLREGFLEDVADLEDPSLGRREKLRVLDRMWKSWGPDEDAFVLVTAADSVGGQSVTPRLFARASGQIVPCISESLLTVMTSSFLRASPYIAAFFSVLSVCRAETHTVTFDNRCGFGTPTLVLNGEIVSNGPAYTQSGVINGIAYLQTGPCLFNGENCPLLEMNLVNPTCAGCGSSTDISLISPCAGFTVTPHSRGLQSSADTPIPYYDGCDGQGKDCNNPNCDTAFHTPTDYSAQVQCELDNVNLLITFCGDATQGQ
ncbi:hypothetical protein NM688_g1633 [Phlebia brevispora]|uniref:Uncharacterized protein n=1 Tax=Phlebia brevispora TaxID=194682 RepID=A0ACC1TAS1_9APHY|nr:hypothetical protein NM688_g1633 [Phlebia brevispora]